MHLYEMAFTVLSYIKIIGSVADQIIKKNPLKMLWNSVVIKRLEVSAYVEDYKQK